MCIASKKKDVAWYIKGCIIFSTSKPNNRKKGLYHPLHALPRPWESIPMDFVGGLQTTRKGHDNLFLVVEKFNNMCILLPYKNTIKEKQEMHMVFEHVWEHFGIPRSCIPNGVVNFMKEKIPNMIYVNCVVALLFHE